MPGGIWGWAAAMAACTSWAAASMFRSSVNWIVIWVLPSALVEGIGAMPAVGEDGFSRGVGTAEAIVSGLAPGRLAVTWMVGKSMLGRSLTGRSREAMMPKTKMPALSSGVMNGRARTQ